MTDQTPLADASELFNSAAVALELSWLRLLVDAGCVTDEQKLQAEAAVSAYTTALQQNLAAAGYYDGEVDGIYGPKTVGAVEELQRASGLPVTGTVDKATAEALQAELAALGGVAAQEAVATTAAVQQTLKLTGFWDGPVDGMWTPELTEAVQGIPDRVGRRADRERGCRHHRRLREGARRGSAAARPVADALERAHRGGVGADLGQDSRSGLPVSHGGPSGTTRLPSVSQ